MPLVSIILPNYNHADFLEKRIESILNQTFTDFELIILDDASKDQSQEILRGYENHPKVSRLILGKENSGSTFIQWKKGIDLAQGKYIWIAESDDLADPSFLACHLHIFEENPNVGLSFSASTWIDDKGNTLHEPLHETAFIKSGQELLQNELSKGTFIYNASSCVFKKELVNEKTLVQASAYKYCGDWLFWVDLASKTDVARSAERLNKFRRHEKNVSFSSDAQGLQFSEGFLVLNHLFENQDFNFVKKVKVLLFWILKLKKSHIKNKQSLIGLLPFPAQILYSISPILVVLFPKP